MMEDIANQHSKNLENVKAENQSAINAESQLREDLKVSQLQNCDLESQIQKVAEENTALSGLLDQLKKQNSELRSKLSTCEEQLNAVKIELGTKVEALESQHSNACKVWQKLDVHFSVSQGLEKWLLDIFHTWYCK